MRENMSDDISPTTKKRKANDGRATVPDSSNGGGGLFSSLMGYFSGRRDDNAQTTTCGGGENLTQKIDTMMQMMIRMEEKCCRLEAKYNSLENSLGRKFEYNNMIVKNQHWKYSTPVHSAETWENNGFDEDLAIYLSEHSECLKVFTEKLRRGEFPNDSDKSKGINLLWSEDEPLLDYNAFVRIRPYWVEFADALKQFTPAFGVLPGSCETFFTLQDIQLPGNVIPGLLKDALMNKPFQELKFVNRAENIIGGMSVDAIIDIVESNKHLRKLTIGNNRIQLGHMERIFSAVCRGSIVELDLKNCFENGLGDTMMTYLLTNGGLANLKRLGLDSNGLISSEIALLANFLATNPPLKELDLSNNGLSGDYVDLLANALRSNTSLRFLNLSDNTISDACYEALRLVLLNYDSLNSIADSNHSCSVQGAGSVCWNVYGFWKNGDWHEAPASSNRAGKIYYLLSERNKSMSTSNVQYFDDIDVKLLPSILEAVQRYGSVVNSDDRFSPTGDIVEALSIVYEVMRKWDKVFPLYTD